ncbi:MULTISPECIES: pyruvate dehydrogenase complex dihydrolipoamide acetyltransferase [unclassified Novosphingobium]|uniref:pyruvate dehydrogenase complex dihydrolipoamide acetyltransferase n=1 Tax=unclassified Novosphingobium TaxID=2644732 RepID=UPI00086F0A17|nr:MULTISPECIES: pyruvate dehydrogenase complex dihydrolipoamide acetyltransferase [unclassified Novosphingobium]MBN9143531.1 pyruvate dehydrogenase complex dihydrolipoamide acetyltransferase [Novosphingobium sp.]ODU83706.1 MAG: pyruvate dehydrogenase complex dihydrolipoamide acetyltransferase [Novosphingobium sp. SCN 63-17]OJX92713.1 MAG: pyruvate dehydrogenase complex dihydrolipoamide acetyltransferase [Novosphingobium sp. 63-713]
MPISIKMPALSPTMEQGKLARWLVKVGDTVSAGDIMAEIETDKATMEFEAVDEGTIVAIEIPEGTDNVKVGTVIAQLAGEGEDASAPVAKPAAAAAPAPAAAAAAPAPVAAAPAPAAASVKSGDRVIASPLAKRIAAQKGVDLAAVKGTGPNGRIVKADVEGAQPGAAAPVAAAAPAAAPAPVAASAPSAPAALPDFGIPHEDLPLSTMRKTIARRLTESKQQVPHIYLTVDIRLDALLKLRGELNAALAARGVKLSVNDMLIKALGVALTQVPQCNVAFAGDTLRQYARADVSVAVSIPNGLITPIITDASGKGLAAISTGMADLAKRAKEGKLAPTEFIGGTASLSNMGMMGIKQFEAVINPPQGMIMAIGAGEKRPWVLEDGSLGVATAMCATGSFDHRAIDGADGAQLMAAFRELIENPLGLLA